MKLPILIYRVGHFFHSKKIKPVGFFFSYLNRILFGLWLPSSSKIGKNFTLGYWGMSVVIHNNTVIGDNCLVAQNVTIGRNFGSKKVPIIGNDVYIGAGSVVFGGINIGNNVIIGSNSVINKSVPDNCTVAGNPFRVIAENREQKYYQLDDL